ncbi:MAG: hypothetical protein HC836_22720 [Richelia sp. RM2_1_2]|nr:hypothetical protein [Richelia sp. RM2_1_2]
MQLKPEPAVGDYTYIVKTRLSYNIEELTSILDEVEPLIGPENQLCVTCRPGVSNPLTDGIGRLKPNLKEKDYSEISPIFKNTIFEKILTDLDITWGRARIMRLVPNHCMTIHPDMGWRYHVALRTNPNSFIFFKDALKSYHIPVDGYVYKMDATKWHTAFNSGKRNRFHFVIADGECFDEYRPY